MSIAIKEKRVMNIGQLKAFIKDIPDTVSVFAEIGERGTAYLWKKDSDEIGPKFWFSIES